MSEANLGRERIEAVAENAARERDHPAPPQQLWYMVLVERRRRT